VSLAEEVQVVEIMIHADIAWTRAAASPEIAIGTFIAHMPSWLKTISRRIVII
jgi:hypothetical protein